MNDYTPKTEDIRELYAHEHPFPHVGRQQFDRWLAQHDAEVRADEREKAAQRVASLHPSAWWVGMGEAVAAARGGEE